MVAVKWLSVAVSVVCVLVFAVWWRAGDTAAAALVGVLGGGALVGGGVVLGLLLNRFALRSVTEYANADAQTDAARARLLSAESAPGLEAMRGERAFLAAYGRQIKALADEQRIENGADRFASWAPRSAGTAPGRWGSADEQSAGGDPRWIVLGE